MKCKKHAVSLTDTPSICRRVLSLCYTEFQRSSVSRVPSKKKKKYGTFKIKYIINYIPNKRKFGFDQALIKN